MPETTQAPALGYSIVANLGGDRQMTVQCFADSEEPVASIHAKIDKAMVVIDRQRAKYRLTELVEERHKQAVTLGRAEDDLARVEGEFQTEQARIDAQLGYLSEQIAEIDKVANARGRTGGAVGAEKARQKAMREEVKSLVEVKSKQQAEREQHRQNVIISIARFKESIEKLDQDLAECKALIGEE